MEAVWCRNQTPNSLTAMRRAKHLGFNSLRKGAQVFNARKAQLRLQPARVVGKPRSFNEIYTVHSQNQRKEGCEGNSLAIERIRLIIAKGRHFGVLGFESQSLVDFEAREKRK